MYTAPPNFGKPWTPEDLSELRRLYAEGISVRGIAKALGRSHEAVAAKARLEKLTPQRPRKSAG